MKKIYILILSVCSLLISCVESNKEPVTSNSQSGMDRTILPIKEPVYPAITELDARNAKAPARFEVKAPEKAPNVVIVLIDDIGFGHSSAFGGPINMPTLEKLAANGLKYNRF